MKRCPELLAAARTYGFSLGLLSYVRRDTGLVRRAVCEREREGRAEEKACSFSIPEIYSAAPGNVVRRVDDIKPAVSEGVDVGARLLGCRAGLLSACFYNT